MYDTAIWFLHDADTGGRLEFWSHQAAHLSPAVARKLATALAQWADSRQERNVA